MLKTHPTIWWMNLLCYSSFKLPFELQFVSRWSKWRRVIFSLFPGFPLFYLTIVCGDLRSCWEWISFIWKNLLKVIYNNIFIFHSYIKSNDTKFFIKIVYKYFRNFMDFPFFHEKLSLLIEKVFFNYKFNVQSCKKISTSCWLCNKL